MSRCLFLLSLKLTRRTTVLALVSRLQSVRPEDKREDGMIQWDKFARFGQILSSIPECQQKGPMITGTPSETFRQLVMDTPVIMSEDVRAPSSPRSPY